MADITISRANFLASGKSYITKSASADAVTNASALVTETDADGLAHKVLKAGTLFNSTDVKGIVYEDVDLTGTTATTKKPISVVVAGHYIASKLPTAPADNGSGGTGATTPSLSDLKAQGLFPVKWVDGTVTRPNAAEDF